MKDRIKNELKELKRRWRRCRRSYERVNKGALTKKMINGRPYYYLVKRQNGKLTYTYRGKLSKRALNRYKREALKKKKLRRESARLGKEIRFRERLLRVITAGSRQKVDHPTTSSGIVRLSGF